MSSTASQRAEAMIAGRKADTSRRCQRTQHALAAAVSAGEDITPGSIARRAGVDRSFLYRHPDLLAQIHAAQTRIPAASTGLAVTSESLRADLAAAQERTARQAARIRQLEHKLSELLGQQAWRDSGLGALQLERKDEDLQAARAANRELMTQLNVSLPAQRR